MIRRGEVSTMQALSLSLQATLAMAGAALLALINISLFSVNLTALFLPVGAIYLWPFRAHYGWSLFGVWCCGLMQDVMTGGPIGFYGLLYVITFALSNPTERQFAPNLRQHWMLFALYLLPVMVLAWILSAPSTGQFASPLRIGLEGVWTIILFPLIYGVRQWVRHMTLDESASGYYL